MSVVYTHDKLGFRLIDNFGLSVENPEFITDKPAFSVYKTIFFFAY